MFCSSKTSPNAPIESNSHPHPTTPSSDSAHNSQCPPPQISPLPNPAPPQAVHSLKQSFLSHPSPRNCFPLSLHPRLPTQFPHSRPRYLPPAQSAPPHSLQERGGKLSRPPPFLLHAPYLRSLAIPGRRRDPLSRSTAPPLRPRRGGSAASHKKSSRPPGIAESPHRSIRTPANAPPPTPPQHETLATPAAGGTAQAPPNSASPSPRSTHSPAPPHLSPAAAEASAPAQPQQTREANHKGSICYAYRSPHLCRAHSIAINLSPCNSTPRLE